MQTNMINQIPHFTGKVEKTKNGNNYEKSNTGKVTMVTMCIADAAFEATENGTPKSFLKKELPIGFIASLGVGWIFDYAINKTRKKDADLFAETKTVKEKTHSGLKKGLLIGAGLGTALSTLNKNLSIARTALGAICLGIMGLGMGLIYDAGVNKFREKLLTQDSKRQIKQTN